MITLYTIAFNEEVFLQYMIDHYRSRFPNCRIVVFDNESTDHTPDIAKKNNCEVTLFKTNNQVDDFEITKLKNNCWKTAGTDWVLICDVDELLNINEQELKSEESAGVSIIRSEGWNMVNMEDNYDFANIKHGARVANYDKSYLFNKKLIKEINYSPGCHRSNPVGAVKMSSKAYHLWHYKCIHPDHLVERYRITALRLSERNKRCGMGTYWLNQTEETVRASFANARIGVKNNKIIP
jgi:glycosyltransferase involved in cell wall biosynthesis